MDQIQHRTVEPWEIIQEGAELVGDVAREVVVDGLLCGRENIASRMVYNLADQVLPPETAKVVSTLLSALPFFALSTFAPRIVSLPVTLLCFAGRAISQFLDMQEAAVQDNTIVDMMGRIEADETGILAAPSNGNALALVLLGAELTIRAIAKRDPLGGVIGVGGGVLSMAELYFTGFLPKVAASGQELFQLAKTQFLPQNAESEEASSGDSSHD